MSLQKLASFLSSPLEDDFKHEFDIEYFAKKASQNYISNKTPLNESIKKYASDNGFNVEQTKRICEAANHEVNQHLFNTQEDKNIYFDIADASQITDEVPIKTASINEYSFTPKEIHSWTRKDGESLQKTAQEESIFKVALNVEVSGLDPKLNLQAVQQKVASALQKVQDDLYLADFKVKEAKNKLYKEARLVLQEAPYYKLAQAIAMSTNRHEILEDLTYDLMKEQLISEEDMFAIVKTAGELEEKHPIVIWTKKFASILDSFDSSLAAEKELQTQLLTIEKELK